ncbi:helix-turn-helix domain-containing protein [Escherichia albertii]
MEKFHMFDDRIYQMSNKIKAADRIIYTVMLNEQKYYHDKGQYYTPSYAHLGQYAGITRTSVIACMKRLEAYGLIRKTNVASNQCIIEVFSLDEVPEVLTEPTAKEARKAKLESKAVKKDDPLSQNSLPTESKFFTQSVKILDTYNNKKEQKELPNNNNRKDDFEEGTVKNGASLCDSHECDSLGIKETIKQTVLDDLEASSEEANKRRNKNPDVNRTVNQKNTPCPAIDDDDELPDPDEDDDLCDDDELPDFEDDYGW